MTGTFKLCTAILLLILSLFYSCKTGEKLTETRLKPISPGRLFKNIEESAFDYNHFSVRRINVQIDTEESKNSFRAAMQAIKDRQILISVSKFNIPLGRISLTPDSVIFINYMERTYLADNYGALSDLLNFDLDFNAMQAILSGNIFSFFDDENELKDYESYSDDGMYIIQSEKMRKLRKIEEKGKVQKAERMLRRSDEDALVIQTFSFDPQLFVLRKMVLEDKTNFRSLNLRFSDYQTVDQKEYPGTIEVNYLSEEAKIRLELKMSGFSTEHGELLPLKIPEKYQPLYLN